MKKLLKTIQIVFIGLVIASCSTDDTDNISDLTFYPEFTLTGEETIFINTTEGETYAEPGVLVTENEVEIDYDTDVVGVYRGGNEIDINVDDLYQVTYTATNQDGFSGTASRDVWVYTTGDLVNSIEGLYTSTVIRNNAGGAQYTNMQYILIWKNEDGTYGISDAIGGYYMYGRAYGVGYAAQGLQITANNIANNDFSFNDPIGVGAFGGNLTMTSFTVNPDNNTINFVSDWDSGYVFDVTLTQVQP